MADKLILEEEVNQEKKNNKKSRKKKFPIIKTILLSILGLALIFTMITYIMAKVNNLPFFNQASNNLRALIGDNAVGFLQKTFYQFSDWFKRSTDKTNVEVDEIELQKTQAFLSGDKENVIQDKTKINEIEKTENIKNEISETKKENIIKEIEKPDDITPLVKNPVLEGEGIWRAVENSNPLYSGEEPIFYVTELRPDIRRNWAKVTLCAIKLDKINLQLVAGSHYYGINGQVGEGVIKIEDRATLLASFNGGFQPRHDKNSGFIINGKEFLPLSDGKGTLIVYDDNKIEIKKWSSKEMQPIIDKVKYARQSLYPLIGEGAFNPLNSDYWGYTRENEDATYNWRSGIGITSDGKWLIYTAGNPLSAETLAIALNKAKCSNAIHCDMNISNIAFNLYKNTDGYLVPYSISEMFWPDMVGRYLKGYTHDFFYITLK